MKQADSVLEHLTHLGPITGLEAMRRYGVGHLPSVIRDLKKAGHPIDSDRIQVEKAGGGKATVALYSLSPPPGGGALVVPRDGPVKALLVEDQPLCRALVVDRLLALGFDEVVEAATHEEFVSAWGDERVGTFDLVVLDNEMPRRAGLPPRHHALEILREVRCDDPVVPVIVYSGSGGIAEEVVKFAAVFLDKLDAERLMPLVVELVPELKTKKAGA